MILVTGANGMMGGYIGRAFEGLDYFPVGRDRFDICNLAQCESLMAEKRPRQVFHLAAETDVDLCERDPDHAYRTNVVGAQNVARLAARFDAELIYVSTTGIFDGEKADPYTEFDGPNPLNVYAKTKTEAEKISLRLCPRCYILRAGWVFGGGPEGDKKFVGKIVALCQENKEIRIVNDKFGSPTYAYDFLHNARAVMESGYYGTYHLTNEGFCTRFDIAEEIVRILGLNTKIEPVSSGEFPLPALRPRSDAARNYHLELLGLNRMRPWQDALRDYLADWPAAK